MVERATLDIAEAAQLLGISTRHAYDLVKEGQFPGVIRMGERILISKVQLERFVNGEVKSPALESR